MTIPVTMVGTSAAIRAVDEEVDHAARCTAKVLITGESGVGKEIVARSIHERSHRRNGPMVTINCAALPDSLLESELFGHLRGSFTDAHRDKRGWLDQAHGGTIFMDEVGEMSLRMQALLLRFRETGEIQRVGADRAVQPVDVRVITATHRSLLDRIADKTFREDLYYRLNVVHIEVPPLRARAEDIAVLLHHFLGVFSHAHRVALPEVTPEALALLNRYHWPGNVRELRNVAERLVLRCRDGRIRPEILPLEVVSESRSTARSTQPSASPQSSGQMLFERLCKEDGSFWSEVYEPFMARDLTRNDVREVVRLGLEQTRGNYKSLVAMFHMPPDDYKKFLSFLRKYQCHVPFQRFRMSSSVGRPAPAAIA